MLMMMLMMIIMLIIMMGDNDIAWLNIRQWTCTDDDWSLDAQIWQDYMHSRNILIESTPKMWYVSPESSGAPACAFEHGVTFAWIGLDKSVPWLSSQTMPHCQNIWFDSKIIFIDHEASKFTTSTLVLNNEALKRRGQNVEQQFRTAMNTCCASLRLANDHWWFHALEKCREVAIGSMRQRWREGLQYSSNPALLCPR